MFRVSVDVGRQGSYQVQMESFLAYTNEDLIFALEVAREAIEAELERRKQLD